MARYVSPELRRVINESGKIVAEVDVKTADGDLILSSTEPLRNIKVTGGSITTDGSRDVPGSGTVEITVDETTRDQVMPYGPRSPLSPIANSVVYVRYRAGDDDPTDQAALTPYGAYEIADTNAVEDADGVKLTLDIYDNARKVQRARFFRPRVITAGSDYDAAFLNLLVSVLPRSEITVVPTGQKVGLLSWDAEDDRLAAIGAMMLMVAYRADWNDHGIGDVLIGPMTSVEASPVWTFEHGGSTRVTTATRRLSDEAAFNGIIVSGEPTGAGKPPVKAEWWDTDPTSPTYFDPTKPEASDYGPHPDFHTSIFAHTTAQALNIAKSLLPSRLGLVEQVNISTIPHPGITPEDPIEAERPKVGITGTYIAESVTIPLVPGSGGQMSITCRERRLVE